MPKVRVNIREELNKILKRGYHSEKSLRNEIKRMIEEREEDIRTDSYTFVETFKEEKDLNDELFTEKVTNLLQSINKPEITKINLNGINSKLNNHEKIAVVFLKHVYGKFGTVSLEFESKNENDNQKKEYLTSMFNDKIRVLLKLIDMEEEKLDRACVDLGLVITTILLYVKQNVATNLYLLFLSQQLNGNFDKILECCLSLYYLYQNNNSTYVHTGDEDCYFFSELRDDFYKVKCNSFIRSAFDEYALNKMGRHLCSDEKNSFFDSWLFWYDTKLKI